MNVPVPAFEAARLAPGHSGSVPRLTHLQQLEAESTHIIRETVAESDNPVLLYSIGKDSSVLLHLALKAFYPGKPPFPLPRRYHLEVPRHDRVSRQPGSRARS
jgi:sulfate adenylyltransferase subunit 2